MESQRADIPADRMPRHIAIIMDGNGRWAVRQGLPRVAGHERGSRTVRDIVTECARLQKLTGRPECVTLYSFSTENWKRPPEEVAFLMEMYGRYLAAELPTLMENNLRFRQIGRREGLPAEVLAEVDAAVAATAKNTGMVLSLAVNYGSRSEIVDAVRQIAEAAQSGRLQPADIDEAAIETRLYTAGLPDPDLLIRTAGEMRLSNYLLWQISYAELYVTDVLWPDFGAADLQAALKSFASRGRRFGGVESA
jgi:undecaprenyl diphosphate synthase